MSVVRKRAAAALIAVGLVVGACADNESGAAPPPATTLQELVDGARGEGSVELWTALPTKPETIKAWQDAFNKRFDLDIEVVQVAMPAATAMQRVSAESAAGQQVGDLYAPPLDGVRTAIDEQAVMKVDWVEVFGEELPQIKEAADVFAPELTGYALHFYSSAYVLAYNTKLISKSALPTSWEGLGEPGLRSKFALDTRGTPFFFLSYLDDWPEDRLVQLVESLKNNDPQLVNPSRLDAVTRGEAALEIGTPDAVERLKQQGAPIDYVWIDPVPFNPAALAVPAKAKHPNAARLFAAWAATEGMAILTAEEGAARITDPNSPAAKAMAEDAPGAELAAPSGMESIKQAFVVQRRLAQVITGT